MYLKSLIRIFIYLSVFFPIIFIVYGLGSRQGLAIGYFFYFYTTEIKLLNIAFFVSFFSTNINFIILFCFTDYSFSSKKKLFLSLLFFLIVSLIIIFFQYDYFYDKITFYIFEKTYHSVGAPVRATLLSIFSLLFLYKIKNLINLDEKLKKFLIFSSFIIIFLTPISFFLSTPVDRILAFFLIIKLIISEEVLKNTKNKLHKKLFSLFFIFVGFVYLVSWIYFGENSWMWNRFNLIFY